MMGNISKTAEPSVFIVGTDLRVGKGHHILEGVRLPQGPSFREMSP